MRFKFSERNLLRRLLSQEPAARLIRMTAKQQWRLLAINLASTLVEAISEGATLGVVYLAVQLLSSPLAPSFNTQSSPILKLAPGLILMVNGLPPSTLFMGLLAVAVILQALQSITNFFGLVSLGYFSARCRALVTAHVHRQVLSFSYPCASGYKVGDLNDYAATAPDAIQIQIEQSSQLLIGFLLIVSYLTVLMGISSWLLLAVALMTALLALVQKQLLPLISTASMAVNQIQVSISSYMTENFQGLRLLHSSGQLDAADQRLSLWMGALEREQRALALRLSIVGPFSNFLPILVIAGIAALSLLLHGERTNEVLPGLVTFVTAIQRLNQRLSLMASNFDLLAENRGRLSRLNQILSPELKQFRRLHGRPYKPLDHGIRFNDVDLCYSAELTPALINISFNVPKGQVVALVGPSGAGKSSVADLLTGLYEPTAGKIFIDNIPLNQLDLASWQQNIGVVSQDTFLFNATIAENVAFGTPDAIQMQIASACQDAQAAGFIKNLPQGYNTVVGERGHRLSGGQRQRLSLARAILRKPDLLILDEATSALDSQNEWLVQQAIERFERDHTIVLIAHRLSTVKRADKIIVLDKGRIVEQGTHAELLASDGLYRRLWKQQGQRTTNLNVDF